MTRKFISTHDVRDGETICHATYPNHVDITLCEDSSVYDKNLQTVFDGRNKITCPQCIKIINHAKAYEATDILEV